MIGNWYNQGFKAGANKVERALPNIQWISYEKGWQEGGAQAEELRRNFADWQNQASVEQIKHLQSQLVQIQSSNCAQVKWMQTRLLEAEAAKVMVVDRAVQSSEVELDRRTSEIKVLKTQLEQASAKVREVEEIKVQLEMTLDELKISELANFHLADMIKDLSADTGEASQDPQSIIASASATSSPPRASFTLPLTPSDEEVSISGSSSDHYN